MSQCGEKKIKWHFDQGLSLRYFLIFDAMKTHKSISRLAKDYEKIDAIS